MFTPDEVSAYAERIRSDPDNAYMLRQCLHLPDSRPIAMHIASRPLGRWSFLYIE